MSTLIRRISVVLLFCSLLLPVHAVLKEANLEKTLSILRGELTHYYTDLEQQAEGSKRLREQVINSLINIVRRSNQSSLMLYSQKPEYVFDLTYACHEATELYFDYHRAILPFRSAVEELNTEVARYDSLVYSLNNMSTRSLSDKAAVDRNVCLTLAVNILRTLKDNRQSMSEYVDIYDRTEERLRNLNDYANLRYDEIQNNIFINGGESYPKILSHLDLYLIQTKESVIDKYLRKQKVRSDWDSRMMLALFGTILLFGFGATLVNLLGMRYLPQRLRTEGFQNKQTCITMATTVITFALALGVTRLFWDQNFFIMASGLLMRYAWLLGVILISLLLRVDSMQIKSAFHVYSPLILIGFIVFAFRIILIPNGLVNLLLPPILLVCALWQWWVIKKHSHNIPRSDVFYSYISLLVFVVSVVCSWIGYTLMSVQLLIWWIMQLTCILTITCARLWIKEYGERHGFANRPISETWFFNFIYRVLLPACGVLSVLLSIYWAADIFNLTALTWHYFTYRFISSSAITISMLNIVIVIILWMLFSYINQTAQALLRHYYHTKNDKSADSRIVMGRNLIQVVVWGLWLILSLAICRVDNTWLVVVSGGLSTGVGFASKDILENIYYGLSLMAGRISVGDWIICDGIRGRVSSINYTSTMLETVDGSVIAFQNSQLFTKNYKNLTRNHGYELRLLDVGIAYGSNVEETRRLLVEEISKLDFVSEVKHIEQSKKVRVMLHSFGDNSVNLKVLVWVPVLTQFANDCEILECVYNTLNKHHIEIPFPQRDLHIVSVDKDVAEKLSTSA